MFKNKKKGFTLIELVIVIAIIGILIAIALPRFAEATQGARNRRIDANARTIASTMSQWYADQQAWPKNDATDTPKVLQKAGVKNPAGATYAYEVKNNEITVTYTWTDDGEKYTGTIGEVSGTTKVAKFKF